MDIEQFDCVICITNKTTRTVDNGLVPSQVRLQYSLAQNMKQRNYSFI